MTRNGRHSSSGPRTATENELQATFSACTSLGEVGIVTFEPSDNAETAIQRNGQDPEGRGPVVNTTRPR